MPLFLIGIFSAHIRAKAERFFRASSFHESLLRVLGDREGHEFTRAASSVESHPAKKKGGHPAVEIVEETPSRIRS